MSKNNRAIRILNNHLNAYNKDPIDGIIIESTDNALKLTFTLIGPKNTPWEDYPMFGTIEINDSYPFTPPNIKFSSKTLHPNIYKDGKICLSILNNQQDEFGYFQKNELWSPALDIRCIFLSIMSMFHEPNLESPADVDSCVLYRNDRKKLTLDIRKLMNS